ncbi:SusC/RagA family TonB-linked outer membrane protein [Neptunitalea lumnitzerae]|uniref:SusC/RagA family TonB-linked outer membrane protein n=1 Tax=Neptunitalea lumnitzerae TaxID=2965509 RepID=A0ABQ5MFX8_9FLAO|nr:TonB-dependent receptor [Neptunitalea sp. Y10]GLB48310.1 SusC/RagA family TonB-linked outer membrane protein [Neptunitalea sp. Y10]
MITIARLLGSKKEGFQLWKLVCLVSFVVSGFSMQAQNTITGTVISGEDQSPLPGASVMVKGTSVGTSTDFDGNYSINVNKGDVLEFAYVGFVTQEIVVGDASVINVTLEVDATTLDDVVVIGYGAKKKSDLTGSVAVVEVEEAKKNITHDVAKMLQGQVAGVTVQSSGEPGGFVNLKIRGISSFRNNNPLFVIDGMLVDNPYDFAPGEIESIQVLKDASSAAIYGVRGANGVVIITTKKGKEGKLSVKLKSMYGFQTVPKEIPLTDRVGYQTITNAAYINSGQSILPGNDPSSSYFIDDVDTDWQDAAYTTGEVQNHSVSFSGGAESLTYNMNLDYFKNSSYVDTPQDYERLSTIINLTGEKGKFKYGAKVGYTSSDKENFNEYLAGTSSVINLLQAIPTMPVYDENRLGGYGGTDNFTQRAITLNVIGFNRLLENTTERKRFIGNVWTEVEVLKNLKYTFRASADRLDEMNRLYNPESDLGWYYITTADEASLNVNNYAQTTTILDNLLNYDIEVGKHKIGALAGVIQQRVKNYNHWSRGVGYSYGTIPHLEYADSQSAGEYEDEITTLSYLSRLDYSFDDTYMLTFNFRQDKSSLFTKKNNAGNFFSFSAGWKLHKTFELPEWFSTLKLRGGYGELGNNTIGVYEWYNRVNSFASYDFNDELAPGTTVVEITDSDIRWEVTTTTNAALEFGMFKDRLTFTTEYYLKTSDDLLADVPLPYSVGVVPLSITTNAAKVRNSGFEFAATYQDNPSENFGFSVSANIGTLKNEVLSIGDDDLPIYGVNSKTEVGRSIGELFAYETEGLFQSQDEIDNHAFQSGAQPGDVKFRDVNGDGLITDDDRTFQGVTIPKISYGLNFSCNYKDFDFSMFWQGAAGHKIYNGTYNSLMIGGLLNHHEDMLNFWTPDNTDTNIPRPDVLEINQNARASDRFIEKGDYIKLQNVQIGYTLPLNENKYVKRARVYAQGQNLFAITGYRGYDPDFMSDGLFSRGYDFGSFPNPRTVSLGVEVDF